MHNSLAEIQRRFGPTGLRDYAPADGGVGRLTDHTQMTLFTAEGLIRTMVASVVQGEGNVLAGVGRALLRWYHTQAEHCALTQKADLAGWLFRQPALHSRRRSASTCLEVLRDMRQLDTPAENHSKDCGALTRSAPVGLLAHSAILSRDPEDTFDLGVSIARLTHGHPDGVLPAGVLALLVLQLLGGVSLRDALGETEALAEELGEELGGMQASSVALPGAPTSFTPPVAMTVKLRHVAPALALTKELPPPPLAAQ
jgi:ADP-ribosylglycohydrolase